MAPRRICRGRLHMGAGLHASSSRHAPRGRPFVAAAGGRDGTTPSVGLEIHHGLALATKYVAKLLATVDVTAAAVRLAAVR